MNFRRFLFLVLSWHFAQWMALAAPAPLQTLQNQVIRLPAVALTTNGVSGLTNGSPNLMVSGVVSHSLHGGTVSLVNTQAWVQRFNDSLYNVYNLEMAVDHAGNVLVTGTTHNPFGSDNLVTIKYSPAGAPLWTNRFTGPINKESFGGRIGIDGNDNVYITGNIPGFDNGNQLVFVKYASSGAAVWTNYFNSTSTNSSETGQLIVNPSGSSYMVIASFSGNAMLPAWIVRYDNSGTAQWTNAWEGGDYPNAIASDGNENLFVAGGVENIGEDMATIKYSPNETPVWTNLFDYTFTDQPAAMTVDSSGNIIVTGDSLTSSNHYYSTLKYGNDGGPMWTNIMAAPGYQGGNVPEVVTDLHNNVFITGGSANATDTNADFTTVKLTSAGIPVWTNRFLDLNTGNPFPAGTAVDSAGNFYFCGHSIPPGGSSIDYVTIKYLADGTPQWTNRYDGPGYGSDYPNAVAVDPAGNVYVTGQSAGLFGNWDFATVKYADYLVYTPPTNFVGSDTLTFTAVDQFGNVATNSVTVVVLPASLRFNPVANLHLGAQGLQLQVDGAVGSAAVVLFRSTDLMDWQPILTNIPALGSVQFLDTSAGNSARVFYRAMQGQ